jgi:hypothetical protein
MKERRPRHAAEVGDASHIGTVELHREHVRDDAIGFEMPPNDALAEPTPPTPMTPPMSV